MSLFTKSLDDLEELDLQALISNQVPEGKTLDYKETLPGNSDDDRKEYQYDVSSFANAAGGFLIYGMKENGGIPTELCGILTSDIDKEKLRLESMIQDGIQPRIAGISLVGIPLQNGCAAFVMRIPKSWSMPHMVTFKRASRFYSRNSSGKYQLDVQELRAAFVGSETAAEHIRDFRTERLGKIVAGETPVPLGDVAKIVLHLVIMALRI